MHSGMDHVDTSNFFFELGSFMIYRYPGNNDSSAVKHASMGTQRR